MITVLATGAAGYIGSVLCPALLAAGHRVIAVDSFRYGEQQATALAACCSNPNFELQRADVRDPRALAPLVKRADVAVPLAALVGAPLCARCPDEAKQVNQHAIEYIAAALSQQQLLIYPNTNSAYGRMPVGRNEPLDEDGPQVPLSHYAEIKCVAETAALEHTHSIVFRLATVFGASPRMRTDLLVNDFVLRAVRDRSIVLFEAAARRNYVHVRDVADAFLWAIERWTDGTDLIGLRREMPGKIFNLGHDGSNCTKRELCAKIAARVPQFYYVEAALGEDPDKRDYVISNERLRRAGFEAKRGLDEGIDELVKLYQAFPTTRWGNV